MIAISPEYARSNLMIRLHGLLTYITNRYSPQIHIFHAMKKIMIFCAQTAVDTHSVEYLLSVLPLLLKLNENAPSFIDLVFGDAVLGTPDYLHKCIQ